MYATGLGDTNTEKCVIWGSSSGGTDYTLESLYEDQIKPMPRSSESPFGGGAIKDPKFTGTFPEEQAFYLSTNWSAVVDEDEGLNPTDMLSGAHASNEIAEFHTPIHVLAGLLKLNVYLLPDDTVGQTADDFYVTVHLHVKRWKPLVFRPKRKAKRGKKSKRRSSRGFSRTTRYRFS